MLLFSIAATMNTPILAAPPNIVFILADDLGYGDLGCYGQKKIRTPRLDRMAAEGMIFTDCYAGSTVCAPSRCVLMTGLHTGHARVRGNALVPLLPEDVTVAEILCDAGYRTALIGKWGLGEAETTGIPNQQGFDYFFGFLNQAHAHNYYPEFLWRDDQQVRIEGNIAPGGVATRKEQYATDIFMAESLRFLSKQSRERPFFLYLALTAPHANNEAGRALGNGMEIPELGEYAKESWPEPEKGRAAMITRLDADVGRVLDLLGDRGLLDNTIVFFSSDNGPHKEGGSSPEFFDSSGPLRGSKRDLYEGGIRVPMIAYGPGLVPAGKTSNYPCGFWDFLPTAAELAGTKGPAGLDGQSLMPTLRGEKQNPPGPFYWEFHERGFNQAIRLGNWKGVRKRSTAGPVELYDLTMDLGETTNVAERHPEVVTKIRSLMESARTPSDAWPIRKELETR